MKSISKTILLSIVILWSIEIYSQEPIWLSNQPPKEISRKYKYSGMHRYCAIRQKTDDANGRNRHGTWGKSTDYVQWLRKGKSVAHSQYYLPSKNTEVDIKLKDPFGKGAKIELIKDSLAYIKFQLEDEGRYNAYVIIKEPVNQDTLLINIAKAELYSHSCRNGHSKKIINRPVKYYPDITDFEIIRIRKSDESLHHYTSSGDNEIFQVLYKGEPLKNVSVKIYTQKAWNKTLKTDKNGQVNIDFIQDYFSKIQELNRRKTYYYLVQADLMVEDSIQYQGKTYHNIHYITTVSDGYRPWRMMYKSKLWGLIIFFIVLVLSIIGIFIYKERRKRPYKEIVFNEEKN